MRLVTIFAVALALASTATAQRGGFSGGHGFAPAAHAPQPSSLQGRSSFAPGRQGLGRRFNRSPYSSLLLPLLGDDFGLDDSIGTSSSSLSDSPMMLLQAMREMQNVRVQRNFAPEPPPGEPLMIELRGDQYVRVNSPAIDGEAKPLPMQEARATLTRPNAQPSSKTPASGAMSSETAAAPPKQELPSAILIFRDGHREEVRDYTIADGVLYARGDLYTDGYWSKRITLASLNLPQTLQANADRNVQFALPSSPNEVIARF